MSFFFKRFFHHGTTTQLYLDPIAIDRVRAQSAYRLHAIQIPLLRLFGFSCITLFLLLHNWFILEAFSERDFAYMLAIVGIYVSVSWFLLWRYYHRVTRFDLGLVFLGFDIVILTLFVYFSGGEKSWLFFVLMARTADQANTTYKRTLVFAHLATLAYVLLIFYLRYGEQRPIPWAAEGTKIFIIYATNLYIASAAHAAANLRRRLGLAIRMARDLLTERQQAEEALRKVHMELEQRVLTRTAELALANASLQEESHKRLQIQDELVRIRNIESLGVLAGGIAHDFNNVLGGIMGYLSLARISATSNLAVSTPLQQAEKACQRAAALARQLLTFATGGAPVRHTVDLTGCLKDSVAMALHGTTVQCESSIAADLWPVDVDLEQMQQALTHLLNNAKQAMPHGGLVTVQAQNVVLTTTDNLPCPPGRYLKITIADAGHGIAAEQLSKIFDPYFTTRQTGRGLGLTTTHAIIRKHDGHITVTSTVGEGTTFTVYLPASSHPLPAPTQTSPAPACGQGRILVMDDEEMIRAFLETLLPHLGYEVSLTRDGAEAVAVYRSALAAGQRFDAVILDLTVPGGMGGQEARVQLLQLDPQVKGIVSSGYSNDPIMANFRQYGFCAMLAKPYTIAELTAVLHEVLQS